MKDSGRLMESVSDGGNVVVTIPETRSSLIARIGDSNDADAWREFAELYDPFIYQQARSRGLRHDDARELVQEVLLAVSRCVAKFEIDEARGRFRTWLFAIGRNICSQRLAKLARAETNASDCHSNFLNDIADPATQQSREFSLELRRHAFTWVASQVRREFRLCTWKAFWMTAVENVSVEQVAESLKISVGAVYIARSRVMARMRVRVQEITVDELPQCEELTANADEELNAPEALQ